MNGNLRHCTGGSDQDIPKKKKCKKAERLPEEVRKEEKQKTKEKRKDIPI